MSCVRFPPAMPVTQDDLTIITELVQQTVTAVLQANIPPGLQHEQLLPSRKSGLDERSYRKLQAFGDESWKDFQVKFKAATRGTS